MSRRCDVATSTDDMTPAGRTSELASILAQAALRLRARAALNPESGHTGHQGAASGETSVDSARNPLDLSAQQSVHGDVVKSARGSPRTAGFPGAKTSRRRSGRWRV